MQSLVPSQDVLQASLLVADNEQLKQFRQKLQGLFTQLHKEPKQDEVKVNKMANNSKYCARHHCPAGEGMPHRAQCAPWRTRSSSPRAMERCAWKRYSWQESDGWTLRLSCVASGIAWAVV